MGDYPAKQSSYDDGDAPAIRFSVWLEDRGLSRTTGWNYRQRDWIEAEPIAGVLYLSLNQIAKFNWRASRGDFAKVPASETDLRRRKKRAKSKAAPQQLELDL